MKTGKERPYLEGKLVACVAMKVKGKNSLRISLWQWQSYN